MMHVPTVTIDDLKAYHEAHFSSSNSSSPPLVHGNNPFLCAGIEEATEHEIDDGLGYYSDGVKRTLTDEQIAIFRHSETQMLLREERLREEQAEESFAQAIDEFASAERSPDTAHDLSVKPKQEQQTNSKKRKRPGKYGNSRKKKSLPWTNRRLARELDEVRGDATATVELDY